MSMAREQAQSTERTVLAAGQVALSLSLILSELGPRELEKCEAVGTMISTKIPLTDKG